jgi:NAD(P)H-dependent flavin oxidoreductase YrpB (nitropropane dioxygenase family)
LKGSAALEDLEALPDYCGMCGWALALAHAKSGDAATIAGYCGRSEALDEAIAKFALSYAKQTEQDHEAFAKAARSGRIRAISADA